MQYQIVTDGKTDGRTDLPKQYHALNAYISRRAIIVTKVLRGHGVIDESLTLINLSLTVKT